MLRYSVALAAAFGSLAAAQAPSEVPAALMAFASRPPMEVVFLLASASVPAGIEVRESDDIVPKPPPEFAPQPVKRVAASAFVQAFNDARRDYQAVWSDGVFVIRPLEVRAPFLDSASTIVQAEAVIGTMEALRTVLAPLDPRLREPVLGGGMGREAARGHTASISLDGRGRRVIDTLNQIVTQTPGAWKVTTRRNGKEGLIVSFGYVYARGSYVGSRMPGTTK